MPRRRSSKMGGMRPSLFGPTFRSKLPPHTITRTRMPTTSCVERTSSLYSRRLKRSTSVVKRNSPKYRVDSPTSDDRALNTASFLDWWRRLRQLAADRLPFSRKQVAGQKAVGMIEKRAVLAGSSAAPTIIDENTIFYRATNRRALVIVVETSRNLPLVKKPRKKILRAPIRRLHFPVAIRPNNVGLVARDKLVKLSQRNFLRNADNPSAAHFFFSSALPSDIRLYFAACRGGRADETFKTKIC